MEGREAPRPIKGQTWRALQRLAFARRARARRVGLLMSQLEDALLRKDSPELYSADPARRGQPPFWPTWLRESRPSPRARGKALYRSLYTRNARRMRRAFGTA